MNRQAPWRRLWTPRLGREQRPLGREMDLNFWAVETLQASHPRPGRRASPTSARPARLAPKSSEYGRAAMEW